MLTKTVVTVSQGIQILKHYVVLLKLISCYMSIMPQ